MASYISETIWWDSLKAVVLENEFVEVVIFPEKGGEIHRYRRKDEQLDYLHVNRNEVDRYRNDTAKGNLEPLGDYFFTGCYTMFPNAGVNQTYNNVVYDYHGDLRSVGWKYNIEGMSIKLSALSARVPLGIERTISLVEHSTELLIEDTLFYVDQGDEREIPYIYGIHPYHTFPLLDEKAVIKVGGRIIETLPNRLETLKKLEFVELEDQGIIEVINPRLLTGIRFNFDPKFMKYVWIWFNFDPAVNQYMNAIIPCTANGHNGIAGAVKNGSILYMKPGDRLSTAWSMEIIDTEASY